MKTIKALIVALILTMGLSMAPALMTGCSTGIFQSDPVGASLFTIKSTYEASVKTAGRLYVQGQISEAQLRKFRDEANKFYKSYTAIVTLNEERKLSPGDARIANLQLAVDALEALVLSFSS